MGVTTLVFTVPVFVSGDYAGRFFQETILPGESLEELDFAVHFSVDFKYGLWESCHRETDRRPGLRLREYHSETGLSIDRGIDFFGAGRGIFEEVAHERPATFVAPFL